MAQFIGHPRINVLPALCQMTHQGNSRIIIPQLSGWWLDVPHVLPQGATLSLAIRPEQVIFTERSADEAPLTVPFTLGAAEWSGNQTVLYGDVAGHPFSCSTSRHLDRQQAKEFSLTLPPESILLFDEHGRRVG